MKMSANMQFQLEGDIVQKDSFLTQWTDSTQKETVDFHALTQRPILAAHIDWELTSSQIIYKLFQDVPNIANSTLFAYLDYFAYYRMDLEVIVKLNGTGFHQGLSLLSFVPATMHPVEQSAGRGSHAMTMSAFPHLKLQAAASDSLSLVVPYSCWAQRFSKADRFDGTPASTKLHNVFGTLVWTPVVPLNFSTGASTSISMNIWIKFNNVSPSGYTYPTLMTPSMTGSMISAGLCAACLKEPCVCKSVAGPPTPQPTQAYTGAAAADPLAQLGQTISGAINTVGNVASSIAGIAGLFLDKPVQPSESIKVTRKTGSSWIHGAGSTNATALATSPLVPISTNPRTQPEKMTLKNIITTPAIIDIVPVTATLAENTLLAVFPVTPIASVRSALTPGDPLSNPTQFEYSPMAYVAQSFLYWRGSIKYHFDVVASSFQQATIAVVWIPDATDTTTAMVGGYTEQASRLYQKIVEIKGPTTFDFEIPFMSRNDMKVVGMAAENYNTKDAYAGETLRWEQWNGVVKIYLVNKLIAANNTPTTIHMVTWTSAGDDMEFYYPNPVNIRSVETVYDDPSSTSQFTEITSPPPPTGTFSQRLQTPVQLVRASQMISTSAVGAVGVEENVQEGPPDQNGEPSQPIAPTTTLDLVGATGESHMDVYKIMKRPQRILAFSNDKVIPALNGTFKRVIYIPVSPQYSADICARPSETKAKEGFITNYLQYYGRLAMFWRGSLEYRIVVGDCNVGNRVTNVTASFLPLPVAHLHSSPMSFTLKNSLTHPDTVWTQWSYYDTDTQLAHYEQIEDIAGFELEQTFQQGTLSVVVPYVSHTPYLPTAETQVLFDKDAVYPAENTSYHPLNTCTGYLAVTIETSENNSVPASQRVVPAISVYASAGDDFEYLLGAPPGGVRYWPLSTRPVGSL